MRTLIFVLTVASLTGCASTKWNHPTRHTQQDLSHDTVECQAKAGQAGIARINMSGFMRNCMVGYGWIEEK